MLLYPKIIADMTNAAELVFDAAESSQEYFAKETS